MPGAVRPTGPTEMRCLRLRMQLSQPQFAARLGVSAETYRAWDSGRRAVPDGWLEKARTLAVVEAPDRQWSLPHLATQLGIHVRTLRHAARNGRLTVTYGNRVVFRNPVPTATLAAGRAFIERYYKRSYSRFAPKPIAPVPVRVPPDCAQRLRAMRLLAMGYAALGDAEHAFACLERAYQTRSAGLIYLHLDPGYAPLRTDARFDTLTTKIGLH